MRPITISFLKYSSVLLLWLLILWWVSFLSPFNIPEFIPYTPIKLFGVLFSGFILTILIISQKEMLRKNNNLSMIKLILFGTLICFTTEFLYQLILLKITFNDGIYQLARRILVSTIFCTFLSFFVAFQLKTKKTRQLVLIILTVLVLFKLLTKFLSLPT